jgi:hypothetical protein
LFVNLMDAIKMMMMKVTATVYGP